MANKKVTKEQADQDLMNYANEKQAVKPAAFNPAKLSIEQQESVVEEFLGVHPKYFLYQGNNIKLNFGRYEAENRRIAEKTGEPRVYFNGWKPKARRDW